MDDSKSCTKKPQGKRSDLQTPRARNDTEEKKAPYKTEPALKEECHIGEIPCPVPLGVE